MEVRAKGILYIYLYHPQLHFIHVIHRYTYYALKVSESEYEMLPSFHIELEEVPYVNAYMQSK